MRVRDPFRDPFRGAFRDGGAGVVAALDDAMKYGSGV